ncbi:MAG: hypothetical protein HY259_09085 [Chloroflexi bacterium]|nr:hypothetical protein [Chloroflexota bacterium]MBI3733594.1 hypothetical protein [Chloroflexota bacterium]
MNALTSTLNLTEEQFRALMLSELSPTAREMFERIKPTQVGCRLMRFLRACSRTYVEADASASPETLEALKALAQAGLICRRTIEGLTFYGLAEESPVRQTLDELCIWQERWLDHAHWVEQMFGDVPRSQGEADE